MTSSNHLEEKSVISKIGSEFCGLGSYVKVKKIVRVMRLPTISGSSNMPLFLVCGYEAWHACEARMDIEAPNSFMWFYAWFWL